MSEIEVKALEWDDNEARSSLGDLYAVQRLSENVCVTYWNGTAFPGWSATIEAAKQAAQSDFDARIRSALVEKPAVFASRYDEQLGECVPVEIDPPMLAKLRERVAIDRKAEPVGYCSEYGLSTLASKAHHYCLSVSKKAENEFQFPLYSTPPAAAVRDEVVSQAVCRLLQQLGAIPTKNISQHDRDVRTLIAALSASPSPVDSLEALIERLVKALELAEGRLDLLLRNYPDESETCDHPVATRYVLSQVRAALSLPENAEDRKDNE